jgi:hypothetical protein
MTEEEVLAFVAQHAGPAAAAGVATRFEPREGQPHPGNRVFVTPVDLGDGVYLALAWMFGYPDPDEARSWKVRWHSAGGPFGSAGLEAFARGLA